jgi:hypothetical protein
MGVRSSCKASRATSSSNLALEIAVLRRPFGCYAHCQPASNATPIMSEASRDLAHDHIMGDASMVLGIAAVFRPKKPGSTPEFICKPIQGHEILPSLRLTEGRAKGQASP